MATFHGFSVLMGHSWEFHGTLMSYICNDDPFPLKQHKSKTHHSPVSSSKMKWCTAEYILSINVRSVSDEHDKTFIGTTTETNVYLKLTIKHNSPDSGCEMKWCTTRHVLDINISSMLDQ